MYGKEKWFYYFRNDDCDVDCRIVVVDYFAQYPAKIDQLETPSSVQELIDFGYLKKGQDTCPDHSKVVIENGQAISQ